MTNRVLLAGAATGPALVLDEPLSMWGGLDPETGEIIDRRHPQAGATATGAILVLPAGRGSSSSSSVLAEAIRRGTAPVALVLSEPDDILLIGALVARELYGVVCPIVVAAPATYQSLRTGDPAVVTSDGAIVAGPCPVCGTLDDHESGAQKGGRPEDDTFIPPAVDALVEVADLGSDGGREHRLLRCPRCGSHFRYDTDYEFIVPGTEDTQDLRRVTPAEAAALLRDGGG